MRILLISANTESFPEPVFPLGLVYIANAFKRSGAEVRIFDMRSYFSFHSLRNVLNKFNPGLIGISLRNIDNAAYPGVKFYLPYYKEIVKTIRNVINAPIVLGGSGFSLFPCEINEVLGTDGGIKGEAESVVNQLLNTDGGKILSETQTDIEDVRIPDDIDTAFPCFGKYRTIGIQTARGCNNRCVYCTYPVIEGRTHRKRSPDVIAEEIFMMNKKYGKRNFFIVDSIFNADERHMEQVLKKIIAMDIRVRLYVYLQPRVSDTSIFKLLRRAGCMAVDFGTDSGSSDMLISIKKSFTLEDIQKSSRACASAGIDFCHSLIFGGPGETQQTIRDTVSLMDEVSPKAVIAMTGVRVYPGTEMERIARKETYDKTGNSLLVPTFYFSAMGREALLQETYRIVSNRKNWFFPGRKLWSDTLGYRLLHLVYRKGPLWRTFRSN